MSKKKEKGVVSVVRQYRNSFPDRHICTETVIEMEYCGDGSSPGTGNYFDKLVRAWDLCSRLNRSANLETEAFFVRDQEINDNLD